MSRFRTLVLLAAVAALATAFAACGGGGSSEDPQAVLEDATLEGVESGDVDVSLQVKSTGEKAGNVDLSLSGPFQGRGKEDLPLLDLSVSAKGSTEGKPVDFEGDLTLLADRAFVGYEGTEYEVDPTTFGVLKSGFEQAEQGGSQNSGNVTACQEAAQGLKIADFAENLTSEGGVDVDGTSTTKVSGDLNGEGALDAITQLTEAPGCAQQLEAAGPLPLAELEKARDEVGTALKQAQVDVYVGDDDIIRRVVAAVTIEPKDAEKGRVEIDLDVTLSGVNEEQEIAAPGNAQPLQDLFLKLGINPLELLEGGDDPGALLDKLLDGGSSGGGGGSGGGGSASGGSGGSGADQAAYLECLQEVRTAADLDRCANLNQ